MKVFIVNGNYQYRGLFEDLGFDLTSNIQDAGLVCFTGGSDVTPSLYNHKQHHTTMNSLVRDDEESRLFRALIQKRIPLVGICRGAQFLNVMSGGTMYQDVGGHCRDHHITDLQTGESILVSSTHHQMMKPSSKGVLVASAGLSEYRIYWNGDEFVREVSDIDYEVVFYPHTNALCFQPHPEMYAERYMPMKQYFGELLFRHFSI